MQSSAGLESVLGSAFWSEMNNIYTAIPCVVIAVREGGDGALVDIQPTINQKFVDGTVSQRTPILGVPVSFPMSSSAGVMFPIKVGTTGLAIFSMRNLESWKASNGASVNPLNRAKFDKSDAIFFPGIQPPNINITRPRFHKFSHSNEDLVLFNNIGTEQENEVRLKSDGDIVLNTDQSVTINAKQDVNINCENMSVVANSSIELQTQDFKLSSSEADFTIGTTGWQGSINGVGGTFTYNGVEYNTHVHTGVDPGNGTSGPPV